MADADSRLQILIEMIADTTGAKVAEADAQKLLTQMDALKVSAEEMNTHLPEGAAAWSKYKSVLSDTTKEAEKLGLGHHQLFYLMEQTGTTLPGLGFLLRSTITPATVAIIGLTAAWEIWNYRVKESTEFLSGMELPDISGWTRELPTQTQMWQDYAKALWAVTDAYNSIDAGSDRRIKKLKDELELQRKLVEAQKEAALAALEQNKKNLSPEEYSRQKALIEGNARAQTSALEANEAQAEIEEKNRRRHELQENAAANREAASRIHVSSQQRDDDALKKSDAMADAAKKAIADANEKLDMLSKPMGFLHPWNSLIAWIKTGGADNPAGIAQADIAQAEEIIRKNEQMHAEQPARKALRDQRQKLLDEAGKQEGEARVLDESIPEDQRATNRRSGVNQIVTNLKTLSDLGVVGNPEAVREIVKNHQQNQQQLSLLLNSMGWAPQVVANMQRLITLHQNVQSEMAAINARIDELSARHDRARQ